MSENLEDKPTDRLLERILHLLVGNEVRTLQVSCAGFTFKVTYDLRKLTRFAHYNPTSTADPTHYMCQYILASVTHWTVTEHAVVTVLPLNFESLLRLGFDVVMIVGKAIASDYALVTSAIHRVFS